MDSPQDGAMQMLLDKVVVSVYCSSYRWPLYVPTKAHGTSENAVYTEPSASLAV